MDFIDELLNGLEEKNLYRTINSFERGEGLYLFKNGKKYINFASNDYLSLAFDRKVRKQHEECLKEWGSGSGAARLITGGFEIYEKLEERLAKLKKTESALLFSCGYMANLGILSSLFGKGDAIFSDELNHASIIDGCKLSKAEKFIYNHKDLNHLEKLLKENRDRFKSVAIVTDSVFSMDGDIAPLDGLVYLADRYGAYLIVDDAHATGVVGFSSFDLFGIKPSENVIIMGTLGKAIGTYGAFVASSNKLREFFINRARTFIFTTSLPPFIVCATLKNLDFLKERMAVLKKRVELFKNLTGLSSDSAIFPIFIGNSKKVLETSKALYEKGFIVTAIRPPTVPKGTERLRITIAAGHKNSEIENFSSVLNSLVNR